MNNWHFAAGLLSGATCLLHFFAGGPETVPPLLSAKELGTRPKFTAYYCWHLVTLMLATMSAGFLFAALGGAESVLWTLLASASMFWSLGMIVKYKLRPTEFPQWMLFAPIAICGVIGQW